MQFIEAVLQAAAQHNIACVLVGPQQQEIVGAAGSIAPPAFREDDNEELTALRMQVQNLTTQLTTSQETINSMRSAATQAAAVNGNGGEHHEPQGADNGSIEDAEITVLGFSDEKLERKLVRLGYNTVGKLRVALATGRLAEAKIKKDWLIDIGSRLAGAAPAPSGGGAIAVLNGAQDVPEGHMDRAWLERLGVARTKQSTLIALREALAEKQAEVDAFPDQDDVPDELQEQVFAVEEDVEKANAQLVAIRWCLNLDPDPELTLDDALDAANLGPYKEHPTPRVLQPQGA